MTKKRVGFILNAMVVAAIAVPALVSAAGNPLPAPPRKCDSSPSALRRCPLAGGAARILSDRTRDSGASITAPRPSDGRRCLA
jgi:hypothetical protein